MEEHHIMEEQTDTESRRAWMYGYVLAPAVSPMSIESHCEWLRAFFAVGCTCMSAANRITPAPASLVKQGAPLLDEEEKRFRSLYATL